MNYIRSNILRIIGLVGAVVLTLGSITVFAACGVSEDHVMACHYAQLAVTTLGTILVIQSLASLIIRNDKVKLGITISQIPVIVAVFFVPGTIFSLCMMSSMRCISLFKPAVRVTDAILLIVALADIVLYLVKNGSEKSNEYKGNAA